MSLVQNSLKLMQLAYTAQRRSSAMRAAARKASTADLPEIYARFVRDAVDESLLSMSFLGTHDSIEVMRTFATAYREGAEEMLALRAGRHPLDLEIIIAFWRTTCLGMWFVAGIAPGLERWAGVPHGIEPRDGYDHIHCANAALMDSRYRAALEGRIDLEELRTAVLWQMDRYGDLYHRYTRFIVARLAPQMLTARLPRLRVRAQA